MTKARELRSNMAFNIVGAIVALLVLLGLIVSVIGLVSFTEAFRREYAVSTYHMADTAATLVNGDHLEAYLAGDETEEYLRTKRYLDGYCRKMSVSIIYVISVDRSDYGRFVSVFNSIDNSVGDTNYTEWELGHPRDTTSDEYRQKYRSLYEQRSLYETVYRINKLNGAKPHITTIVPVKASSGEVAGLLCIQRPMRELYTARLPYVRKVAVSTVILAILASVFAASFIRSRFLDPIRKVSDEAVRFARENTKGEELGIISEFRELADLGSSIDSMETDMLRYMENLTKATAERERIAADLSLASTIQENSIPNSFPAFPERSDFDIYAVMDPAREVGGDFYNFSLIDDDHLFAVIGDVSGKGIPGALFMMVSNILISDRTRMGGTPAEILNFVNQELCAHNKADMFVTVWLGILELSTGRLTAANAGHEYPAIRRANGRYELFKDRHGFVLGAMEGVNCREYELTMEPGDRIFVYTDGVPEATADDDEMFGTDRMLDALNTEPDAGPERLLKNVRDAVDDFVDGAEQFDDLTMLCLEYRGSKGS